MRRVSRSQKCYLRYTLNRPVSRFCKQRAVNSKKKPPEGGLYYLKKKITSSYQTSRNES
jgi:hypothetical protein